MKLQIITRLKDGELDFYKYSFFTKIFFVAGFLFAFLFTSLIFFPFKVSAVESVDLNVAEVSDSSKKTLDVSSGNDLVDKKNDSIVPASTPKVDPSPTSQPVSALTDSPVKDTNAFVLENTSNNNSSQNSSNQISSETKASSSNANSSDRNNNDLKNPSNNISTTPKNSNTNSNNGTNSVASTSVENENRNRIVPRVNVGSSAPVLNASSANMDYYSVEVPKNVSESRFGKKDFYLQSALSQKTSNFLMVVASSFFVLGFLFLKSNLSFVVPRPRYYLWEKFIGGDI